MTRLDRREFLKAAGCLTVSLALPGHGAGPKPPPNIVVIFTDDQGYGDVGCFGAKGFKTPNLDRMARDGMRFTSFYVSQAVCSASRTGLLTGCYPNRVGILGALGPKATHGINPNEMLIPQVLKQRGYATAIFGKWHLGHHKKFLPLQHGFDEYFGLPYSNDMWPLGFEGKPPPEGKKAFYPPLWLIEGNEPVRPVGSLEDQNTLTTLYTERAVRFIERNKDRPFFLYVPHSMPHVPLGVSDRFRGKSEQGMYGDVMMEVDWSVGEILAALRRNGLEENTLVVFTTDNGPWLNFGNHAGSAGPLREGKATMFEGGVRVPCIMRWPDRIPEGSECDKMAATIDLLPTFAAIADAPLPPNAIDGVNILPLMQAEPGAYPRKMYYYYWANQLHCLRLGRWKLHFPHKYYTYEGNEPGKDGRPGATSPAEIGLALYDLEAHVGERNDVAAEHTDLVQRMKRLAEIAREELGDEGRRGKGYRPPGTVE
jgi:arylsulfatase A